MKVFHNFYDELVNIDNIFKSWKIFRSGKSGKKEVIEFEHNLENDLFKLHSELSQLKYKHGKYIKFMIKEPKERIIHKSLVRDRVVHTIVARKLEEIYQPIFINHSYACQKNKGTNNALKDLVRFAGKVSYNYNSNFWYLKCDIKKFFDNIDHDILIGILKKKIKDEKFLNLIDEIVGSFHKDLIGKGLPLGNYTSQWLANIYLNELDFFIKHRLKIRYYLRYSDDFLILGENEANLNACLAIIAKFLFEKLKLRLNGDKTIINIFSQGIDFVGYKVMPHYIKLRKKSKKQMLRKINARQIEYIQNKIGVWQYYQTLNSYLGLLKHANEHNLTNKIIYKNI